MSAPFAVGTVCIGQHFVTAPEYNGRECVVLEGLHIECAVCSRTGGFLPAVPCYFVRWAGGEEVLVDPRHLRRKQPPTGLASILRMFDLTAPAPREVEAA